MKNTHNISPEELERIERFLTNEMPENEAIAFAGELKGNTILQEKTEEVRLLLLGISEQSLQNRLDDFHKEIGVRVVSKKNTPVVTLREKLLIAASVLAIISLSLWWFLQNESQSEKIYSNYYKPDPGLATVMGSTSDYDFEKAMVEYKNGEYEKALKAWQALLAKKPGNDTLVYFIGSAYQAMGDNDNAINNLQQITADSNSAFYKDACWYLGLSYLKKAETNKAIDLIQRSGHSQADAILKDINKK